MIAKRLRTHPRLTKVGTPARMGINRFVAQWASEEFTLDLGCGHSPYAQHFPRRVGFDWTVDRGVHVVGSAMELPFRPESFGRILCTEVLEHVPEPRMMVDEMLRVLQVGGKAIVTTRFCYPLHLEPHDYFRFSVHGMRHLFRNFQIDSLENDCSTISTAGILLNSHFETAQTPWLVRTGWKAVWKFYRLWYRRGVERGEPNPEGQASSGLLLVATKTRSSKA